jgi:hypothetical protein
LVKLRNFSEIDGHILSKIGNDAFCDEIARGLPSFTPDRFQKMHRRNGIKLTVSEHQGKVVGFIVITIGKERARLPSFLKNLWWKQPSRAHLL